MKTGLLKVIWLVTGGNFNCVCFSDILLVYNHINEIVKYFLTFLFEL